MNFITIIIQNDFAIVVDIRLIYMFVGIFFVIFRVFFNFHV